MTVTRAQSFFSDRYKSQAGERRNGKGEQGRQEEERMCCCVESFSHQIVS